MALKMKNKLIEQLAGFQSPDGSFKLDGEASILISTAQILQKISCIDSEAAESIKGEAGAFLISMLNHDGTFGDTRNSTEKLIQSFEAWTALCLYDQRLLTGDYLGKIMKLLTSIEAKPGGPYHNGNGIDLRLNYSITKFLKTQNVELDSLTSLLKSWEHNEPDGPAFELINKINRYQVENAEADPDSIFLKQKITDEAFLLFSALQDSLNKESDRLLKSILEGDKENEITLLAYNFYKSLDEAKVSITPEKIKNLGLVNLYLWLAYTIYDNFLDLEGAPNQLSTANYCLRSCTAIVHRNFPFPEITGLYQDLMNEMDSMNAWEITHCRSKDAPPEYRSSITVASKSIPHSFGPLAILHLLQHPAEDRKKIESFFRHYLAARQLDDDAHDWLEDLDSGQISYVTAKVLEKFDMPAADLEKRRQELQKIFAFEVLPVISKEILTHIETATSILEECASVKNPSYLLSLLEPHRRSAIKALEEISRTEQLISSWAQ